MSDSVVPRQSITARLPGAQKPPRGVCGPGELLAVTASRGLLGQPLRCALSCLGTLRVFFSSVVFKT